jgi:hypothetical protein
VPAAFTSLHRALTIAQAEGWGFGPLDVERVESVWETTDPDSMAHGFVLSMRSGRRRYLQYVVAHEGTKIEEEVEQLPMGEERYPDLKTGGGVWQDDRAVALNRILST